MHMLREVTQLWRYPVKSMLGERCTHLVVEPRGAVGDRLFAVADADGKLGSGKNTRRFRKIEGLFSFHASYRGLIPQVRFPNGELLSGDDPAIHDALSAVLGQPVRLVPESTVSHLDAGAIHLVSCGSLSWLRGTAPEGIADARRFRPNVVVSGQGIQPELAWLDKQLRIGQVELRISGATERCGMVALAQGELPAAPRILRRITQDNNLVFGVYAEVIKPGTIWVGDPVTEVE